MEASVYHMLLHELGLWEMTSVGHYLSISSYITKTLTNVKKDKLLQWS